MRIISKPMAGEYAPYANMYIRLVPDDGMVLKHLYENLLSLKELVYSLPGEQLFYRYAPGKWSLKEVLVHLIDDERIFGYRALRFARGEQLPLSGFDQDSYASESDADHRELDNIFNEFEAVRRSTIALFDGLPEYAFSRIGKGSGSFHDTSVRALVYHIAGHELHHVQLIKTRYLMLSAQG